MGYLDKINQLQTDFIRKNQGNLNWVSFNQNEWGAVLDYYFQPGDTQPKASLATLLPAFDNHFMLNKKIDQAMAKFIYDVYLVAKNEFRLQGRPDKARACLKHMCSEQMPAFFKKGISEKNFNEALNALLISEQKEEKIAKSIGNNSLHKSFINVLLDHELDIDYVAYALKKEYLTYENPQLHELYELIVAVKNGNASLPEISNTQNRYRLYAALRHATNTSIFVYLENYVKKQNNPDIEKLLQDIKNAPKYTVPYFAAPMGSDPLHEIACPTLIPPEGNLHSIKVNKRSLIWSLSTMIAFGLAVMLPVSLGLLAPAWFSVAGLPALVLTVMGVPNHPKIPSLPGYVYGKVKENYTDEAEYLETQEAALQAIKPTTKEMDKLLFDGGQKQKQNETDQEFLARKNNIHNNYYKPLAPFFECLFDASRSIDTLADDLKVQIVNRFHETTDEYQYQKLYLILHFLTLDNTNAGTINLELLHYRMFAALRIIMKDPTYSLHMLDLQTYIHGRKNQKILAILQKIEDCKNTPILDRMKVSTYGHHYLAQADDPIYQLASEGKEKPKRPPLFSAEWVQANKTPILYGLGVIAVTVFVAVAFFPPILGFVGMFGANVSMMSMSAGVAGMGPMTVGTLMLAITAVLSPLAFIVAKFTHKQEIDQLEVNLAQSRELRLMNEDQSHQITKPLSLYTRWFGNSPKNEPAIPLKPLKTNP